MAQISNPAYYAGQQWTSDKSCGLKNEVCRTPWWFLIGMIAALTMGGKKRRARRKAAAK